MNPPYVFCGHLLCGCGAELRVTGDGRFICVVSGEDEHTWRRIDADQWKLLRSRSRVKAGAR